MRDHRGGSRGATSAPLRRLGAVGLVLLAPAVLLVTLWPTHFLLSAKPRVTRGIEWLRARELFDWLTWSRLEVLANVGMFVPVALLLTFVAGARRWWIVVAMCVALSAAIELVQAFMPGRVAAALDVVANTLGALIGALLAVVVQALVLRFRARRADRIPSRVAAPDRP
ncbi:VanZ family protein [Microbacterium sp.]|uniref:VanZ family protein n=1 Tax=Microbacterium sp. TaxID=51671 RepID=UPI00281210BC|nr:VanZ family protein [Microbacterium sp.]